MFSNIINFFGCFLKQITANDFFFGGWEGVCALLLYRWLHKVYSKAGGVYCELTTVVSGVERPVGTEEGTEGGRGGGEGGRECCVGVRRIII